MIIDKDKGRGRRTSALEPGFTRDVRNIGHYGTGSLEITLKDPAEVEKAAPLLSKSYESS